jgi:hypothetical protein
MSDVSTISRKLNRANKRLAKASKRLARADAKAQRMGVELCAALQMQQQISGPSAALSDAPPAPVAATTAAAPELLRSLEYIGFFSRVAGNAGATEELASETVTSATVIAEFQRASRLTGIFSRIAERLDVSPQHVREVSLGLRTSARVMTELCIEVQRVEQESRDGGAA